MKKIISSLILAGGIAISAGANAQGSFATLSNVSPMALSAEQMAAVEGKAHIYLLVESRGVELPARAEMATRAAAPKPMGGDFTRSPSREATAFDFLN